jgi:hypothetical protein
MQCWEGMEVYFAAGVVGCESDMHCWGVMEAYLTPEMVGCEVACSAGEGRTRLGVGVVGCEGRGCCRVLLS